MSVVADVCSSTHRAYGVTEVQCASVTHINCAVALPPPVSHATVGCKRNIFLDMGANWCNTMQLYESLPETATLAHAGSPWHIFAVEAAPLIQPYVERCVAALAAGQPLPVPPVPPAGSSMQLLNYANDLGCSAEKVGRGRRERMNCVAAALKEPLAALERMANPALTTNPALLAARLGGARTRGGCPPRAGPSVSGGEAVGGAGLLRRGGVSSARGSTFELLPAAAGASTGTLRMAGSPLQMLRGGINLAGSNHQPQFDVPKIDVVQWLFDSFDESDFVVLKMDIEGAELEIVPKLLATNATRLLDVFLWECHAKWKGVRGKCQCVGWEEQLRRAGVRRVYREPYRFAPAEKYRAAAWNATRLTATTPTPNPTAMSKDL